MLKCSFAFRIATNTATISFAGVMAENIIKSGGKIKNNNSNNTKNNNSYYYYYIQNSNNIIENNKNNNNNNNSHEPKAAAFALPIPELHYQFLSRHARAVR